MLEHELAELLEDAGLAGRQADAVAVRLGWDGNGTATLEAAASVHGYSRERVRQLEAKVRGHAARVRPRPPSVERALERVESAAPDDRGHVARLLADDGSAAAPFDPAGVIVAADVLGLRAAACVEGRFVRPRHSGRPDEQLLAAARALAAETGDVSVVLLAHCASQEPERVRRLLAGCDEVVWLDGGAARFAVRSPGAERRVARLLPKLLAVAGRQTLADVEDALRRTFNPVSLPRPLLLELCASLPWLQVDDDGSAVASLVRFDRRRVLTPVEQALARIFEEEGPVLTFREVVRLACADGLNRNSVGVYLTHTPILKSLGRGRYALRGRGGVSAAGRDERTAYRLHALAEAMVRDGRSEPEITAAVREAEAARVRARILVAEDETLVRLDLADLLGRAGFDVAEAADGEQAVSYALSYAPDAILMDANMPRLDGISAASRILERRRIPIVMLTGYRYGELVDRALDAGVSRFLVKPVAEREVIESLSAAMSATG